MRRSLSIAASLLVALVFTQCARNPVTGRPELTLLSTEREKELGREGSEEVEKYMGLVEDPELVSYVRALGARLAAHSPRRDIDYTFQVVDMPEPNAFALPGGYIYVSRGLLALTNGEDELANVIGHEIGHVAAKHHSQSQVRQVTFAPLRLVTGIGGLATGLVSPALGQLVAGVGELPAALVLSAYSRDQERQADEVGQNLAAQSGWDPGGMARFMNTLAREQEVMGGDPERQGFLDTHPSSPERERTTAERARTLTRAPAEPIASSRADFLSRLEGLLVGPSGKEGSFDDNRFRHADLDFALTFPEGWKTYNGARIVAARAPDEKALSWLELAKADDPMSAADAFVKEQGIDLEEGPTETTIHGLSAVTAAAHANGAFVDLVWVAHGEHVYQIAGLTEAKHEQEYGPALRAVGRSFGPLPPSERALVVESRLRIAGARADESLEALVKRTGSSWSPEQTAVANELESDAALDAGSLVKVAVPETYTQSP